MEIRPLQEQDVRPIAAAFAALGWNKPESQYRRYLEEQAAGKREVLVALVAGAFAGYLTIVWESSYRPFREEGIPEIVDFNVLPHFRRRKIGTALMDAAEARVGMRSAVAGIGVGLTPDYGPAQRLYVLRGYVPDGRGLTYDRVPVEYGMQIAVGDRLVLHLTKQLRT
ncbi:MAG TPA: GNAT family N-acetyltransferase [Ardenticatenaceae bacterium]|nr:GNAT family N-acetyltransferase [Ardenticatenaceae bacterium]